MSKYLDLETSRYLVSLGCTSESGNWYPPEANGSSECPYCGKDTPHYHRTEKKGEGDRTCFLCCAEHGNWIDKEDNGFLCPYHGGKPLYKFHGNGTLKFSLEDLLRKDVAEKVWGNGWMSATIDVLRLYQTFPEDWPKKLSEIIEP